MGRACQPSLKSVSWALWLETSSVGVCDSNRRILKYFIKPAALPAKTSHHVIFIQDSEAPVLFLVATVPLSSWGEGTFSPGSQLGLLPGWGGSRFSLTVFLEICRSSTLPDKIAVPRKTGPAGFPAEEPSHLEQQGLHELQAQYKSWGAVFVLLQSLTRDNKKGAQLCPPDQTQTETRIHEGTGSFSFSHCLPMTERTQTTWPTVQLFSKI